MQPDIANCLVLRIGATGQGKTKHLGMTTTKTHARDNLFRKMVFENPVEYDFRKMETANVA